MHEKAYSSGGMSIFKVVPLIKSVLNLRLFWGKVRRSVWRRGDWFREAEEEWMAFTGGPEPLNTGHGEFAAVTS
jgi:hypothetical protein